MLERHEFPVLFVAGRKRRSAASRDARAASSTELVDLGHRVVEAETLIDGRALVGSDPSFGAVVLDWDVSSPTASCEARAVLDAARRLSERLPVFLMLDHGDAAGLSLDVLDCRARGRAGARGHAGVHRRADRLRLAALRRHAAAAVLRALVEFANTYEYSMHTPGHAGGTAFRKTAVGKAFYDFYGENLFRTDLSVSVGELGSLLDHSGRVDEAERNAARIFGAETTFFVLNGTSTANQIVAHSAIVAGDVVLADRNCHKSMNYALDGHRRDPRLSASGAQRLRDHRPDPGRARSSPGRSPRRSPHTRWRASRADRAPVYAAVTNSTYDGLCYDAGEVAKLLGRACRGSTSTRPGSPTRPSTRSTATAPRWRSASATESRRCSRPSRRTSCSPRSRRPR